MESKFKSVKTQADAMAREISMLAIACNIDIDQDQVAQRVLKNDSSVCRRKNPQAFEKLRQHLMAFFPLKQRAIDRMSAEHVGKALNEVRASIRALRNAGKA
ncbi:MAG: hypothetical protein DRR11_01085 [Gammaproteobacteria bacterium]|nr:MAG: hypothetical protein DRR11_01085 [Gammaproteobacteria bacterium]RLA36935.1 MAG: hypothetical protein DRR15_03410 [Gammaproteobacteria bacterium]